MDIKNIGKVARNKLMIDFLDALSKQTRMAEEDISKYRNEAFVVEASEETVNKWEKFMVLEYKPDYTLQDRIDRILYTLQSRGSFTKDFLKNQGKIFLNGELEPEEFFSEYHFVIRFIDIVGVPENLENFKDMVDLNKPAHLTYEFKFRYNTHGQLEILTHGEMEAYTHDELYQKRVFDDNQLPNSLFKRGVRAIKNTISALVYPLKTDYYNVDVFNDNFRYLDEHKLEKGTYPGDANDLNDEISKIASTTQLGRIIVGDNLTIDEAGRLSGKAVDVSEKMDKYKERFDIKDYDELTEDGFYILAGSSSSGILNAPYSDTALIQVWNYSGYVNQRAVSFYNPNIDYVRCFKIGTKNTAWTIPCPYNIGDIYHTLKSDNPNVIWPNTSWQKIEGRILLGSSNSYALGSSGGSATTALTIANLPAHRHQVDSTTATIPAHTHTINTGTDDYRRNDGRITWGGTQSYRGDYSTNSAGGGSTGAIAPYTNYVGSGTSFSILPPYIAANIWKRIS